MASTIVDGVFIPDGLGTLTLKLYDPGTTTVLNAGDTASADSEGNYAWTVTEALSGLKHYRVETSGGAKVAGGLIWLADTTNRYPLDNVHFGTWEEALVEAYAADGVEGKASQILYLIQQMLTEFALSGTTYTVKKLDGTTTAATFTLSDATNPTSITRAT